MFSNAFTIFVKLNQMIGLRIRWKLFPNSLLEMLESEISGNLLTTRKHSNRTSRGLIRISFINTYFEMHSSARHRATDLPGKHSPEVPADQCDVTVAVKLSKYIVLNLVSIVRARIIVSYSCSTMVLCA